MKTRIARDVATARRPGRPIPAALGTAGWAQAAADRARIRTVLRAPPDWRAPATTSVPASTTSHGAAGAPIAAAADIVRAGGHALDPAQPRAGEQAETIAEHGVSGSRTSLPYLERVQASFGAAHDLSAISVHHRAQRRFGHDFSKVRVHTGAAAERSTRDVHALAYTLEPRSVPKNDSERLQTELPGALLPHFGHDFSRIPLHAATGTTPAQGAADASNLRESYLKGDHQQAAHIVHFNKGAGLPLAPGVHNRMREYLGHDFSQVRIHTDEFARRAASSLEANAFTVRGDIFFGANMYAPDQPRGIRRLAHELIHTLQQHDTAASPTTQQIYDLENQAEYAASAGIRGGSQLRAAGLCILREPTFPRATTADDMEKEVSRVFSLKRDEKSKDETTRLWSQVKSNFPKTVTAGSLARKVWTNIFFKHFVEPDQKEGAIESAHPRYFFSRKYGWIDAQHFFGFIDFAEQFHRGTPKKLQKAFDKATKKGLSIEETQWTVNKRTPRDPSTMAQDYKGTAEDWRKEEEKREREELGARYNVLTEMASPYAIPGMIEPNPVYEVLLLLDDKQKEKFWIDMAKSAFTYEDFESNQLGTRFYFQYGIKINSLPEDQRASAFQSDLNTFFKGIEVENDPKVVAKLAQSLPGKERFNAPKTTEDKVRKQYPDLFKLP